MSTRPQLEWEAGQPTTAAEIDGLRQEVRELKQRLKDEREHSQDAIREARQKSADAMRAQAKLKQYLQPFHTALQMIFGELEHIDGSDDSLPSKVSSVWESWKSKLGGNPAKLIDSLLIHREMNAVQLRVAMQCHINSVYETTAKLQKMGLLNKNGGKYSLKDL